MKNMTFYYVKMNNRIHDCTLNHHHNDNVNTTGEKVRKDSNTSNIQNLTLLGINV